MKRLIIFGDSICAGSNIPNGGPEHAWPTLLAKAWGGKIEVVNRSRGGRPTGAREEFAAAIADARPTDILVIALGANDARDMGAHMLSRARENILAMGEEAKEKGFSHIILVGPTQVNPDALVETYPIRHERQQNTLEINHLWEWIAREKGWIFISFRGILEDAHLMADGVHPNRLGNEVLAAFFEKNINIRPSPVAPSPKPVATNRFRR